jgi:YebC/PmpR family DNA-binding regulatory protein
MHKKEKTDAQRAKIFTKIGREIAAVVKEGGADPIANARLKDVIAKAKAANVPNDNIDRIIKKASGGGDNVEYLEMVYEGYGPNGVAVLVETLSDNKNRTAGDMRHYFDKFGGNLGTSGSVSWQFEKKGVLIIGAEGKDEDKLMEDILEAGAGDYTSDGDVYEIFTTPEEFDGVKGALEARGYSFLEAEISSVPSTYVDLTDEEDIKKMGRLLEALEDNDDVQEVWHNWGNEPEDEE